MAKDESLRSEILQLFYKRGYPKTKHAFRPHAIDVIDALLAKLPERVFVVTNSNPDTVRGKLDVLSPGLSQRLPVEGNARKFLLESLDRLESGYLFHPGLNPGVRRQHSTVRPTGLAAWSARTDVA